MLKLKQKKIAVASMGLFLYINSLNKKKRSKWVKTWKLNRVKSSDMILLRELRQNDPDDFKNYLRMDGEDFDYLLKIVGPMIKKQDTIMRDSISPEERLVATLRFLATGRSYEDLKFSTRISAPSLSHIIPETCLAIYNSLKAEYMKVKRNTF